MPSCDPLVGRSPHDIGHTASTLIASDAPALAQVLLATQVAVERREALRQECDLRVGERAETVPEQAAYGGGDLEGCLTAWEHQHRLLVGAGDPVGAARAACMVAMYLLIDTGLMAPLRGWVSRAEKLLTDVPDEVPPHVLIAMIRAYERFFSGDPAEILGGLLATPEQIQAIRQQLGLNDPWYVQLWIFVKAIFTFNWGSSWATQEAVSSIFRTRLPATLTVMVLGSTSGSPLTT